MDARGMGIQDIFHRVLDGMGGFSTVGRALRIASILAATASIAWLAYTLWDLPVPRVLHLYIGWMGVITFTAYFVARRIPQNDLSYAIFYVVMLGPLVFFTLGTAIHFGLSLGDMGLSGFVIFAFVAAWFVKLFNRYTPDNFVSDVMIAQGYFFLIAGLLSLAALVPPCNALQFRLRLILGLYWLSVAAYSFCQSLGIVRSRALWASLDSWFAGAMCVVFLGGLAWMLQDVQIELGPQEHSSEQISELVWEAE